MDDTILACEISEGSHNALRNLMAHYYGPLFVFASGIIGDNTIAQDVVQDTFMLVWSDRKKLNMISSLKNYLYGVVRNKCLMAARSSRQFHKYLGSAVVENEDIMARYIETETMRMLWTAVEDLPPRTAQVIRLTLAGIKQDNIALQMDITVATVKALKSEGIRKLRRIMDISSN